MVQATGKRKTIPLYVRVSDINDNTPRFINLPYVANIPEVSVLNLDSILRTHQIWYFTFQETKVGTIIFEDFATVDPDSNINGQVEYFIGEDNPYFEINLPHQGRVSLKQELDFEEQKIHEVTIIARVSEILLTLKKKS